MCTGSDSYQVAQNWVCGNFSADNGGGINRTITVRRIFQGEGVERVFPVSSPRIEKIETAVEPKFQAHFVEAMGIPHTTAAFPNLSKAVTLPAAKPRASSVQYACSGPTNGTSIFTAPDANVQRTGGGSIPLEAQRLGLEAHASDLPHLAEDDPMAKAMKYTNDASSVDPSTRNNPAADQNCANCALVQAGEGDWLPCQIFPGKAVNAAGWCSVWAPKA